MLIMYSAAYNNMPVKCGPSLCVALAQLLGNHGRVHARDPDHIFQTAARNCGIPLHGDD